MRSPYRISSVTTLAWLLIGSSAVAFAADATTHWAFQPLAAVTPPTVRNRDGARNEIDLFVRAQLESKDLAPNPAADKRTLLRRANFDLTGLPPTPEEVQNFVGDQRPDAFATVIERLLASPRYGERWGRHWLDLARYADTAGDSADYPIPQAYRYRDYVIQAFNSDKPYDQFLREQIAGDLMRGGTETERQERLIATGYIAVARRFGVAPEQAHHLTIEDTLDTMSRSVLGLSLSCARCHDHKYDPLTMRDYYGLYGIFSSTRYPFPGAETRKQQGDFVPLMLPAQIAGMLGSYASELARQEEEVRRLEKEKEVVVQAFDNSPALPAAKDPNTPERQRLRDVYKALGTATQRRDRLLASSPVIPTAYAVAEGKPADAPMQLRGEPQQPGEIVPRGFPKFLGGSSVADATQSGRLELARWLTGPADVLTARVMVNRIWQHHFGRGLVSTPSDFGIRGRPPSHPELLDYLARRFIDSGWSIKAMHRLMMLSATYQQSSMEQPRRREGDPENDLLARFTRRRLSGEEIRDAMLLLGGTLDLSVARPHPFPAYAKWEYTQHNAFTALYESRQRSVYLMQQRIKRHPFLALFDGSDPNVSTAERSVSTTPLQALFLMNDSFVRDQAAELAEEIRMHSEDIRTRIDGGYRLVYGRPARENEGAETVTFLGTFREKLAQTDADPADYDAITWSSFARLLLSSNEFAFVD